MTDVATRPHGERAKYVVERCRCVDCRKANTTYALFQQKRKRLEPLGRTAGPWAPPHVDATPVQAHLQALRAAGVGLRQVSRVSGVARSSLTEIAAGRARCRRETAAAVLAVEVADRAAGRWPTNNDRRRFPAGPLLAERTVAEVAAAAGVAPRSMHRWVLTGIPAAVADRAAVALVGHPVLVWPDWTAP